MAQQTRTLTIDYDTAATYIEKVAGGTVSIPYSSGSATAIANCSTGADAVVKLTAAALELLFGDCTSVVSASVSYKTTHVAIGGTAKISFRIAASVSNDNFKTYNSNSNQACDKSSTVRTSSGNASYEFTATDIGKLNTSTVAIGWKIYNSSSLAGCSINTATFTVVVEVPDPTGTNFRITYGSKTKDFTTTGAVTAVYGSKSKAVTGTLTLNCKGRRMTADLAIGGQTMHTNGKVVTENITISIL